MANVAQSDVDALQVLVEGSVNLTNAQKAQSQTLVYSLSRVLFGNAANPASGNGHNG